MGPTNTRITTPSKMGAVGCFGVIGCAGDAHPIAPPGPGGLHSGFLCEPEGRRGCGSTSGKDGNEANLPGRRRSRRRHLMRAPNPGSMAAAKAALKQAENAWRKTLNAGLSARGGEGEGAADRARQAAADALSDARERYVLARLSTPAAKRARRASGCEPS
jgi:hypothetical protein